MIEETQLIIAMFNNNIGPNKIANILNKPVLSIYNCLRENNINKNKSLQIRNEEVCKLYQQGVKIKDISFKVGLERHTVSNILDQYFPERIYKNLNNHSPEKKERNDKIISLYNKGLSLNQIMTETGVHSSTVNKILKDFNITLRPQHQKGHSSGTTKNRKHFFNLSFFHNIDTEEKAYWLGFLYADGYVSERGIITLALAEKDLNHIKKFLNSINAFTIEPRYNKRTKSYVINLGSVEMANDLIEHGCVQKKSLVLKFPTEKQVPKTLINHFMRGYFDGDGCASISNQDPCITHNYNLSFQLLGTKEFLDKYEKILLDNCQDKNKSKRFRKNMNKNTESFSYSSHLKINDIYCFLYDNATIYLERKKEKFNTYYSRLKTKAQKS